MSSETPQPATEPAPALPVLSVNDRRVLGVLVEKAKTTPDVYPLSLNALVTGCNQKSNRDPVLDLTEADVEETLAGLQRIGLAIKITGGRVVRWRHNLYEAWRLNKAELAVVAELLLRGPQTEGELRGRASRMEPVEDLDALRALLRPLAERGLVVYLSPEGRRGTVVTHGFHAPEELARLRETHKAEAAAPQGGESRGVPRVPPLPGGAGKAAQPGAAPAHDPALEDLEARLAQACADLGELRERLASLEQRVKAGEEERGELLRQLQHLQESLGVENNGPKPEKEFSGMTTPQGPL